MQEMKLVGTTQRASNQDQSGIVSGIETFDALKAQIKNAVNPGRVFAVYTEYESDFNGEYSYFFGEEVSSFDEIPSGLAKLVIPEQQYMKFTCGPGNRTQIVSEMWQKIWKEQDGRSYIADFEIYDDRAQDPENAIVDIYVGVLK